MNVSFRYAATIKVISVSPVEGIKLPKAEKSHQKSGFRTRNIDTQKTLTMEQILVLLEKSKDTLISDYVFEAIVKERQVYEKNRNRRKREFQDLDYICCSTYGRPRSKGFHCKYYKRLLAENGLPDIRWHDLRSTYCTLLLKEAFNPKVVSMLMGHAKEIITMDVYADIRGIIAEGVPEIEEYMKEVMPNMEEIERFKKNCWRS